MEILESILLPHFEIHLRADGIVQVNAQDHEYSLEEVKELQDAVWKINGQKKAYAMILASAYSQADEEVRKHLSTPEGSAFSHGTAFVIHSLSQRILVNFLIKVQRRPAPTRFFTHQEAAIDWLHKMKKDANTVPS